MNRNNIRLAMPPQAIEAEQSVIGAMLIAGESAWDRIADLVTDSDFYRDDHRRIFGHIRRLAETGKTIDVVTVFGAIQQANETDQTGGLAYLGEIANSVPSSANIAGYAKIIAEKARIRALVCIGGEIEAMALAPGPESAQSRIDEATGRLLALADHGSTADEPVGISAYLSEVINQIEARRERGGAISGLPTGFADIDEMLDGLKDGDLVIVGGRSSMGKTAFALNIAENVALSGKPVLVFSMEMGGTQLAMRSMSCCGGIDSKTLASGRLQDEDWDKITLALGKLHNSPLVVDQSTSLSVAQMRARARRQKRKSGLSLVVIDYLQLMSGQGNNRNEQLGDITRSMKLMARDLSVPVICLSQLSRKCEERADKRPMLSDLRESGSIEQDADVVMMMFREDYYDPQSAYAGLAECLIRKNRMGACGDVKLVFEKEYSRFRDADNGAVAAAIREAEDRKASKRGSRRFKGED